MLRFDYDRLREPCLLITGQFSNDADHLSELQAAMLRENEITGLMPAVLDSDADRSRFRCYLRERQPISRQLGRSGLTLAQYYKLLYDVTSILLSARAHMLLERNFVLAEEVIFELEGRPQLVYLPLAVPHTDNIGEALLKLAVRWTAYLQVENGRGVAELLALLQSPGCTAESVHKRLKLLLEGTPGKPSRDAVIYAVTDQPPAKQEHIGDSSSLNAAHADRLFPSEELRQDSRGTDNRQSASTDNGIPWWRQRELWVRVALAAVAVIILLQVFWWKPTEMILYACLACGIAVMLLLFGKLPWTRNKVVLVHTEEEGWESFDAVLPEAEYYEQLPNQTVILKSSEAVVADHDHPSSAAEAPPSTRDAPASTPATVLLSDEEWAPQPFLVLEQEGVQADTLHTIAQSGTVLGRSVAESDLLLEEPGISSTHVEFHWHAEQGWSVQDLGSRNGTRVNGEWLAPYKLTRLQQGDRLELPGTCLIVKDLNAGNQERYNEEEAIPLHNRRKDE